MEFIDIPLAGGFIQALMPMLMKFLPKMMAKGVLAGKGGMDVTNIVKTISAGKGGGMGGGAGGGQEAGGSPNQIDVRTGHEYIAELAKNRKAKKDPLQAYLDRKNTKDKQYGQNL